MSQIFNVLWCFFIWLQQMEKSKNTITDLIFQTAEALYYIWLNLAMHFLSLKLEYIRRNVLAVLLENNIENHL